MTELCSFYSLIFNNLHVIKSNWTIDSTVITCHCIISSCTREVAKGVVFIIVEAVVESGAVVS